MSENLSYTQDEVDKTQTDPAVPSDNPHENINIDWQVAWNPPMTTLGKMKSDEIDVEDLNYFAG